MSSPGKRGHNVSRAHLTDRAMFVRLETLRLARICGAGHYSSTFSAAELFAALYYAHLRLDPKDPDLAGPRPLRAEQGSRGDRALSDPGRSRLLPARASSTISPVSAVRSATIRT